jgi:hypothetical protein
MSDKKSSFSLSAPEDFILNDDDYADLYPYGLYRAKISGYDPRLFFHNAENHYTHLEMTRAKQLGYKIRMIDDGEYNVALYEKRISGKLLFGQYFKNLYPFKTCVNVETGERNPLVKKMMNVLWGALAERDRKYYTNNDKTSFEVADLISGVVKIFERGGKDEIETKGEYLRGYARLAPFITAYGRVNISRLVEPIVDQVFRIHTDGFYTTATDLPVSAELGALKLEKQGNFHISSLNNINGRLVSPNSRSVG